MLDRSLVCLWGVVFLIYEEFTFSQSLGSLNLIEDVMKIHINCYIKCSGSSLLFFFLGCPDVDGIISAFNFFHNESIDFLGNQIIIQ